jgi:hypothetical protein
MVTSRYSIAFIFLLSVFLSLGIAIYTAQSETANLLMTATTAASTQASSTMPTVNRSRPGSHTGVMTSARGRAVVIDKNTYRLSSAILIEDRKGMPISLEELRSFGWNGGLELRITYWLTLNEITQIIVTLAE